MRRQLSNMDFYSTALRFFNTPYVDSDAERAMKVIDINRPMSEPFKSKIHWSVFLGGNGLGYFAIYKARKKCTSLVLGSKKKSTRFNRTIFH